MLNRLKFPQLLLCALLLTACEDTGSEVQGQELCTIAAQIDVDTDTAVSPGMFVCPQALSDISEVYNLDQQMTWAFNARLELEEFAYSFLDEAQLVQCPVEHEYQRCANGAYTTGGGVLVTYTVHDTYFSNFDDAGNPSRNSEAVSILWDGSEVDVESRSVERITLTPPEGAAQWTSLTLENIQESILNGTYVYLDRKKMAWTGTVRAAWPKDFGISALTTEIELHGSSGGTTMYTLGGCEMERSFDADDSKTFFDGGQTVWYGLHGKTVASLKSVFKCGGQPFDLYDAWLSDTCVGQVRGDTFDVVGSCSGNRELWK